jgi:hypothetical protein
MPDPALGEHGPRGPTIPATTTDTATQNKEILDKCLDALVKARGLSPMTRTSYRRCKMGV